MRYFEEVVWEKKKLSDKALLPLRSTRNSAGYDFFIPEEVQIQPGESVLIWSDVKACMEKDEVLLIYPRSSVAIKHNVIISNIVGVIDSDYYSNPDNDGNIGLALKNRGHSIVILPKGSKVAQGIFTKYLVADNCNSEDERTGGIGSTT